MIRTSTCARLVALTAALVWAPARAQELGSISFPTSGAPAAQETFVEGVKFLHSFQFEDAAVAFRSAQEADPNLAMAYWGEAMSYNHPLWAQQDTEAAQHTLERIGATAAARASKARTAKEKAYLAAADRLFYGPGDKLARDVAYSEAMAELYERWPDDHEIATFYALSLLGTLRPGDTGFRRQALAASIAERVYRENPNHPGAAHFIIHAFDDPDHAPLALPAARQYADIAPSAAHALHMPSHIFVQLGMWEDVAASNVVAYQAARDVIARLNVPEGRDDFHALSWLTYANLMLGDFEAARLNVETAKATSDRNPGNGGIRNGYLGMRARYILETEQWDEAAEPAEKDASSDTWTFITGYGAARAGDHEAADAAEARLRAVRQELEAAGNAYRAKQIAILEKEIGAVSRFGRGQHDAALALAKEAMEIELTLAAPSGPPEPVKPAAELYGELLLAADRPAEAASVLTVSLQRTPNRTPSVRAMAKAGM